MDCNVLLFVYTSIIGLVIVAVTGQQYDSIKHLLPPANLTFYCIIKMYEYKNFFAVDI